MGSLWDPIRKLAVDATPEEKVRQAWILHMIGPLGYPQGLLSVEKEIDQGRRADLICYTPQNHALIPLLLVECKADKEDILNAKLQVFGYNTFVKAPFVCVICQDIVKTYWKEKETFREIAFLPRYEQLVRALSFRN